MFFANRTMPRWMLACVAGAFCKAAVALTFDVDSSGDELDATPNDGICLTSTGTCTLRAAIMQSNASAAAGVTIVLPPGTYSNVRPPIGGDGDDSGDYNFTTPPASTSATTTIVGAGADVTFIQGSHLDRLFEIDPGRSVAISGVTIMDGAASGGGCIYNAGGTLSVDRSEIVQCTAMLGAGVLSEGTTTITHSTLAGNAASGADLALGGGLFVEGGTTVLIDDTVVANSSTYEGGAIFVEQIGDFDNPVLRIFSSTIAYNVGNADGDDSGTAGGIANDDGTLELTDSIVAGNTDGGSRDPDDCFGNVTSIARNLIGSQPYCDAEGCSTNGTEACTITDASGHHDLVNDLGFFGTFGANGGPTRTLPLLPGSNAIDDGDPSLGCRDDHGAPLATDQRGLPRSAGAACDMGAYEYQGADAIFADGFD